MSSFGHVRDMMERYAANRELLQAKRNRHFRKNKLYDTVRHKEKTGPLDELNKEEWERVKKRIRLEKRRAFWLWIVTSIVAVALAIWTLSYFF